MLIDWIVNTEMVVALSSSLVALKLILNQCQFLSFLYIKLNINIVNTGMVVALSSSLVALKLILN